MSSPATTVVERLVEAFEPHRDEARANQMRSYLRDKFPSRERTGLVGSVEERSHEIAERLTRMRRFSGFRSR